MILFHNNNNKFIYSAIVTIYTKNSNVEHFKKITEVSAPILLS